jgi:hypothetical protein
LIGVVLVMGTLLGGGLYRYLAGPLERSGAFVWAFSLGLPILLGFLSAWFGWRFPETLAKLLLGPEK